MPLQDILSSENRTGDPTLKNQSHKSSAYGSGQIVNATWKNLVPLIAAKLGISPNQVNRSDPAHQQAGNEILYGQLQHAIPSIGADDALGKIAWVFGQGNGKAIINALGGNNANVPATNLGISSKVLTNNGLDATASAADVYKWAQKQLGSAPAAPNPNAVMQGANAVASSTGAVNPPEKSFLGNLADQTDKLQSALGYGPETRTISPEDQQKEAQNTQEANSTVQSALASLNNLHHKAIDWLRPNTPDADSAASMPGKDYMSNVDEPRNMPALTPQNFGVMDASKFMTPPSKQIHAYSQPDVEGLTQLEPKSYEQSPVEGLTQMDDETEQMRISRDRNERITDQAMAANERRVTDPDLINQLEQAYSRINR